MRRPAIHAVDSRLTHLASSLTEARCSVEAVDQRIAAVTDTINAARAFDHTISHVPDTTRASKAGFASSPAIRHPVAQFEDLLGWPGDRAFRCGRPQLRRSEAEQSSNCATRCRYRRR